MSEIQGIAPPDTQPERAIPLPTPPPPSKVPPVATLQAWAPLYFSKLDRTISHLSRVLSTPSGTDTLLLTLNYTSLTASQVLTSISVRALHSQMARLINAINKLPPNTTVLLTDAEIPASRLLRLSKSLRALSSLISDFRIFARLWGLLGIWQWGKGLIQSPPEDLTQRRIAWLQVLVNIFYQYLENGAYLSSKGVLGWTAERQNNAWLWSSRFWAAHVGLDLYRLAHELRTAKKEGSEEDQQAVRATWLRQLTADLAYAPLTIHWSLQKGLVNDLWVGIFGSVAGAVKIRQLWKTTAE